MALQYVTPKNGWICFALALLMSFCSGIYAQGLRLVGSNLDYEQGAYIASQKAFYAAVASSRPFSGYNNRLLKIDPQWGTIQAEFYVGSDPMFLQPTTDQSALFLLADRPYRIKRFNVQIQTIDQDDALEVPEGDVVYQMFSIPKNNKQVITVLFHDGDEYLRVFERGKPLSADYKLVRGQGSVLSALFTQDSVLWTLSHPGTIQRFKIRSNGLHLEKTFTGYGNGILNGQFQVMGEYFVSNEGFYLRYTGAEPTLVGRFSVPHRSPLSSLPHLDYFYALEQPTIDGLLMIKYSKQDFRPVDTLFINTYQYLHPSVQHFQMCTEDQFVVNHFGTVGTFVNCTSVPAKAQINAPPVVYWCTRDVPELSLRTTHPAYQFYWRTTQSLPEETSEFKVTKEGSYHVWTSDQKGCLSGISDPVEVRFLSPPGKPSISHSFQPPQYNPPFQLCKGQSVELSTSAYFVQPEWNTGDTTGRIKVNKAGAYRVRMHFKGTCYGEWSDPFEISKVVADTVPLPQSIKIVGAPSGTVCSGDSVTLEAPAGYAMYDWNSYATTSKNRFSFRTPSWSGQILMNVRVGNQNFCMSLPSEQITINTLFKPVKPLIQRSSNILISSNSDPKASYEWYLNGSLLVGENKRLILAKKEGFYSVRSRSGDCFSPFSDVFSFSGLLTHDRAIDPGSSPHLYPNPADEVVFVQTGSPRDPDLQLTILDAQGSLQKLGSVQWQIDGMHLQIGHLAPGAYVLQGHSPKKNWVLRFIKL